MSDVSLHDRLRDYAVLTDAERAAADAEAARRPDLADAWAEARALAALAEAARQPDDLATRVVDERLGLGGPVGTPEAVEVRAELDRIAAGVEDPADQFERLTGHTLPGVGAPQRRNGHKNGTAVRFATDRPAEHRATRQIRRMTLALVAVIGLYGIAFAGSSLTTPERVRVADVGDVEDSFRAVRGVEVSDRYAEAVETLEGARRSTLGLFPSMDEAQLEEAAAEFAAIAREVPDDGFGKEAALALGRIRLLQGRDEDARTALDAVMAQGGHRAPEAARLLDYLDAQAR